MVFSKSLIRVNFGNVFILEQVLGNRDRYQGNCLVFKGVILNVFVLIGIRNHVCLNVLYFECMHWDKGPFSAPFGSVPYSWYQSSES